MDEILYELREHSAGLNCGRWDYIFSSIKKFCNNKDFVLADRSLVAMTGCRINLKCIGPLTRSDIFSMMRNQISSISNAFDSCCD